MILKVWTSFVAFTYFHLYCDLLLHNLAFPKLGSPNSNIWDSSFGNCNSFCDLYLLLTTFAIIKKSFSQIYKQVYPSTHSVLLTLTSSWPWLLWTPCSGLQIVTILKTLLWLGWRLLVRLPWFCHSSERGHPDFAIRQERGHPDFAIL